MLPVSHTTLANSTADAVGYSPPDTLGRDGAPQGGGPHGLARDEPADANVLAPVPRIEVRRPWWDVRWVLRDWNGMGSLDTFDRAPRRQVARANNNRDSTEAGLAFDTSPVIARGATGQWDEGSEVAARGAVWW